MPPRFADEPRPARRVFGQLLADADGRILYIDKAVSAANAGEDMVRRLSELGVARRAARK